MSATVSNAFLLLSFHKTSQRNLGSLLGVSVHCERCFEAPTLCFVELGPARALQLPLSGVKLLMLAWFFVLLMEHCHVPSIVSAAAGGCEGAVSSSAVGLLSCLVSPSVTPLSHLHWLSFNCLLSQSDVKDHEGPLV